MRRQVPQWALDQLSAEQSARQECGRRWPKNKNWSANEINGAKFQWRRDKGATGNVVGEVVSPLYFSSNNSSPVVDVFVHSRSRGSSATYAAEKLMENVPVEDVLLVGSTTLTDTGGIMQQVWLTPPIIYNT